MMKRIQKQISDYNITLSERSYKNANTFYLYTTNQRSEIRLSANSIKELSEIFSSSNIQLPLSVKIYILNQFKKLI